MATKKPTWFRRFAILNLIFSLWYLMTFVYIKNNWKSLSEERKRDIYSSWAAPIIYLLLRTTTIITPAFYMGDAIEGDETDEGPEHLKV